MTPNPHIRLSKREVANLCGSTQRKHQIGFLRLNGIKHYVDAHGWPVVLWCHIDQDRAQAEDHTAWRPHKVA